MYKIQNESSKAYKGVSVYNFTKKVNEALDSSNNNIYNGSERSSQHFQLYSIEIVQNDSVVANQNSNQSNVTMK